MRHVRSLGFYALLQVGGALAARPDLDEALMQLRARGHGAAAVVLAARVRQAGPKMRLTREQARTVALALLRRLPAMPSAAALLDVMPRSAVELVRAVEERGLSPAEAERIAAYLIELVRTLKLGNLHQFDANHSHVIGRSWHEIDYSGEGTSWQARAAYWSRFGVKDFRRAIHLHRYFQAEERLPYFRRIYRPRGTIKNLRAKFRASRKQTSE